MKIDPSVFQAKFPSRCSLEQCKSRCCKGGVWADVAEKDVILQHVDLLLPFMRPETRDPSCWFGGTMEEPECPSGIAIETNVVGDACVFLHPDHGCALQKAAVESGMSEWALKPRFCIMFPLVVEHGVLFVDEHLTDIWCMRSENRTHPILASVEREVRHLFPEAVVRDLLAPVSDDAG